MNYYTPENMQDKKMSDLKSDPAFLTDALTFLKSKRKGYTQDDIDEMSADDVVSEVLEHFRYQTTNEVTVGKDLYFMNDNTVDTKERESFGRLMFAFDNAKGEGLFDRGAEKIGDYFMGIATAPTTYASAVAGIGTAGAGAAAIQAARAGTLTALRTAGKQAIKRSLIAGMADGAVGATFEYGNQKVREAAAEDMDIDYEVDRGAVALSGALGFAVGAGTYGAGAAMQHRGAKKLATGVLAEGETAAIKRYEEAAATSVEMAKQAVKDPKKLAKMEAATAKVLQAIDPALVKEGDNVKRYILSKDLPDGVVGGLQRDTIQRLSAAAYELGNRIKDSKGDFIDISNPNVRITEVLADNIGLNKEVFSSVAEKFGLTNSELSAVYASEVSTAAKIMAGQSALSKSAKRDKLKELAKKVDDLYEAGMAPAKAEDLQAIEKANRESTPILWKKFKDIENARRMFMTSQPATTMRNNIFSVAMTGIDIVDRLNQSVLDTVFKGRKEGMATFSGSLDNLKYLTRDNYVADALVTMLQSNAPDKMKKVFFDAAVVESHVAKDTVLAKMGAAANTLNTMSDFVVKRAVITGSIDRQLKKLGDDALGNSVMDMLKKGTVNQLPDDILEEALGESLAFTFQRKFGGKDKSFLNNTAAKAIKTIHDSGLTVIVPFPRYLASQAKFVSDYTGLTVARRLSAGLPPTTEELSRTMTGGMMAFGIWNVRKEEAAAGFEWFETERDGKPEDAKAALGPLAPVTYVMDYIARHSEGLPTKDPGVALKELSVIMGSTEFRPGTGILDAIDKSLQADSWEPILKEVGDYASSFTYPAAVLKDFYGQVDPRSSYLAETRDASVSMFDFYGYDFSVSAMQRITRQLPDFDSAKISNQLEELTGISIAPDTLANFLEFASTSTRTYYQTQNALDADGNNMRMDAIRFDIFGDGPLRIENPMMKQITGFVGRPRKNALQREMSRLQVDPFKLYNPYREQNVTLELFTQQKLQGNLSAAAELAMQTDTYQSANDLQKKVLLTGEGGIIPSLITKYRADAKADLEKMASLPEAQQDYISYISSEFKSIRGKSADLAKAWWQKNAATKYGYEGMDINEAIESVETNKGLTAEEKEVHITNLKRIYIDFAK